MHWKEKWESRVKRLTGVPDGGVDGVAFLQQQLHERRRHNASAADDARRLRIRPHLIELDEEWDREFLIGDSRVSQFICGFKVRVVIFWGFVFL